MPAVRRYRGRPHQPVEPRPKPKTDTKEHCLPNVVGTFNCDAPGKLLAALRPYRSYSEVIEHMDVIEDLKRREATN